MKIEPYRCLMTKWVVSNPLRTLTIGVLVGMTLPGASGCKGTPLPFSQSFSGLGGPTRVPAPADGSFQVPSSYSGPNGTSSNPGSGLGGSSFNSANSATAPNGMKTSQSNLPVSNFVNGISAAESQIRAATNNALSTVNRATEDVNNRVEQASARVDRFGAGVVQASNILSEAAYAPMNGPQNGQNLPSQTAPIRQNSTPPASGQIGDNNPSSEASWQTPSPR
ncbi:MAG: hypothetical protein WCK15_14680 [Pirellula sp.]